MPIFSRLILMSPKKRTKSKTRSKSPKLCKRGINAAKKRYKVYPSAYANAHASKVCKGQIKDLNDEYKIDRRYIKGRKRLSSTGLNRWFKEKWVNVCEKDSKGKYKPCGRKNAKLDSKEYPFCRPSIRVTKDTPKTVKEMSKGEIERRCKRKRSVSQGKKGKPTRVTKQKTKFPYISLKTADLFDKYAELRKVSEVARGKKKSKQSDMGFMQAYRKVKGKQDKLRGFPIKKSKPEGQDWWIRRENFCARHLAQMKKNKRPNFEKTGKYKGLPTRQHTGLIIWACAAVPESKLKEIAKKLKEIKDT